MNANVFAGAEAVGEVLDKGLEGGWVRGNLRVGDGEREEIESGLPGNARFVGQLKERGLVFFKKRHYGLDSGVLHAEQFVFKPVAATRAKHDGEGSGRFAFDPEDFVHGG
jgi:hypothetical protein